MVTAILVLLLLQDPAAPASEWFPDRIDTYRHPLADPRAPVSGVRLQFPIESEDHFKVENRLATHVAVFRTGDRDFLFEVQAEGGAFGRFDFDENWDMDAADFRFGFPIAARWGRFAVKVHPWHMTSHLGDEYIDRTGRERFVYARNEVAVGVSWDFAPETRVYAEAGYAFERGDVNEPLRFMAGFETVSGLFFGALNLTSFEEQDYDVQFNIEAGAWFRPEGTTRGVRLSIGYFRGPSALTQFFNEDEEYWTAGFSLPF
jgi:hypothetical protein